MFSRTSKKTYLQKVIRSSEREAQMVSAFARLLILFIAITLFLLAGGVNLPVAPVVLTYFAIYGMVSIISAVCSFERFFNSWMSLLFTAVDGVSLAILIAFALQASGSPLNLHSAVPGFVFIFSILILASMRYTIGPTLVAFISFAVTWHLFAHFAADRFVSQSSATDTGFFFGDVQNTARWGFLIIATILCVLAVIRRRKTLEKAINATIQTANLSRYLPDRVANIAADQGIDALSLAKQQIATVLFVDIRGFTGISEALQPKELGALLSDFRSIVSTEVEACSGIVDKFIGDAVMALFGVPDEQANDEENGIKCAMSILSRIADWNDQRRADQQPEIHVTIGVHCGDVFAGAVGTESRMEYTVLGDTVNIAARLQEAAKNTEAGLVVSRDLLEKAGQLAGESQRWKPLTETAIRGRTGQVSLYEYTGRS